MFSRRVLAHRVSITMEADFCIDALEEALAKHGRPEIFNTDQGSQFTSTDFTGILLDNAIAISMDGKGAWRDNVFVERLWRSVKYEEVYLRAYDTVSEARRSIGRYLAFYNHRRPHSSLDRRTPDRGLLHAIAPRGGGKGTPPRAGRVSGRATPALRHAPRAKLQRTNPGSSPLSLRGILFRGSGLALLIVLGNESRHASVLRTSDTGHTNGD